LCLVARLLTDFRTNHILVLRSRWWAAKVIWSTVIAFHSWMLLYERLINLRKTTKTKVPKNCIKNLIPTNANSTTYFFSYYSLSHEFHNKNFFLFLIQTNDMASENGNVKMFVVCNSLNICFLLFSHVFTYFKSFLNSCRTFVLLFYHYSATIFILFFLI
jgi:hypothetical protein